MVVHVNVQTPFIKRVNDTAHVHTYSKSITCKYNRQICIIVIIQLI